MVKNYNIQILIFLILNIFFKKFHRAQFSLDFQIICTKIFGRALSILKIYINIEGMVNVPKKHEKSQKNIIFSIFFYKFR